MVLAIVAGFLASCGPAKDDPKLISSECKVHADKVQSNRYIGILAGAVGKGKMVKLIVNDNKYVIRYNKNTKVNGTEIKDKDGIKALIMPLKKEMGKCAIVDFTTAEDGIPIARTLDVTDTKTSWQRGKLQGEVSGGEFATLAANGLPADVELIDVRETTEVSEDPGMTLLGAKNIPLGSLPGKIKELDKSKKYYFFCPGGERAELARDILAQNKIYPYFMWARVKGDGNGGIEITEKDQSATILLTPEQITSIKEGKKAEGSGGAAASGSKPAISAAEGC